MPVTASIRLILLVALTLLATQPGAGAEADTWRQRGFTVTADGQRLAGRERTPPSLCDAVLPSLAQLTGLEELTLNDARLGGEALLALQGMTALKKLTAAQIDTPAADVARLRAALPKVVIDWKPLSDEQAAALREKLKL